MIHAAIVRRWEQKTNAAASRSKVTPTTHVGAMWGLNKTRVRLRSNRMRFLRLYHSKGPMPMRRFDHQMDSFNEAWSSR